MIYFERARRGQPTDEWEDISIDDLRQVTTAQERELMIFQKAVIRGTDWKYRRKVPINPKDWSKN